MISQLPRQKVILIRFHTSYNFQCETKPHFNTIFVIHFSCSLQRIANNYSNFSNTMFCFRSDGRYYEIVKANFERADRLTVVRTTTCCRCSNYYLLSNYPDLIFN